MTYSLCTLRLAPNLSLQTLPQTSILSLLWPFLFLPSLFLSLLSSSVSHWGEALMLVDREQNVFRTLCLSFFFSRHIGQSTFMIWLCWIMTLCCGKMYFYWRAHIVLYDWTKQSDHILVLHVLTHTGISLPSGEKKRSLGFWVFCSGCKYPVCSQPLSVTSHFLRSL